MTRMLVVISMRSKSGDVRAMDTSFFSSSLHPGPIRRVLNVVAALFNPCVNCVQFRFLFYISFVGYVRRGVCRTDPAGAISCLF